MKIVFTGGPSSGKTTMLNLLKNKGYNVADEVARDILSSNRYSKHPDKIEALELQKEIYSRQIALEKNLDEKNEIAILDRGHVDNHAYCELLIGEIPEIFLNPDIKKYDAVLLFERLPFIADGLRREDESEAKLIHDTIVKFYKNAGYDLISIPVMSIEDRLKYILEIIHKLENNIIEK